MAHIKKEFNLSVDVINSASECVTGAQCKNQTRTIIVATTLLLFVATTLLLFVATTLLLFVATTLLLFVATFF